MLTHRCRAAAIVGVSALVIVTAGCGTSVNVAATGTSHGGVASGTTSGSDSSGGSGGSGSAPAEACAEFADAWNTYATSWNTGPQTARNAATLTFMKQLGDVISRASGADELSTDLSDLSTDLFALGESLDGNRDMQPVDGYVSKVNSDYKKALADCGLSSPSNLTGKN